MCKMNLEWPFGMKLLFTATGDPQCVILWQATEMKMKMKYVVNTHAQCLRGNPTLMRQCKCATSKIQVGKPLYLLLNLVLKRRKIINYIRALSC